jgi:uncharacterized membrane protein YbaN (DUF454 family)
VTREARSGPVRVVLTTVGIVCVGLGIVGIVVPVLPTTPFLLLAAACFVRSSPRMHGWLLTHPRLGPYVAFVDGGGMPARAKRNTLVVLWVAILASCAVALWSGASHPVKAIVIATLLVVALLVTRYLLRLPTGPDPTER